ncbi:MAG: TcfC E-set like domain-containing protein [Pseudomonadota bacterium]
MAVIVGSVWASAQIIRIDPPPGFARGDITERTIVDVYLNDRLVAAASARFGRNTIEFDEPATLSTLLPNVTDRARVAEALGAPLPAHAELACGAANRVGSCGYVHADVVAVIFDEARFRVDLFINPAFTTQPDPRAKLLPPPTTAPGLLANLTSRSIYDFDRQELLSAQRLRAVAGRGRWAIRGEGVSDLNRQSALRSLVSTYSGRDQSWWLGLLPSQSSAGLAQTERLLGVRVETSSDTRLDRTRIGASLIEVSVAQSAIVEIRRAGETLDVQRVEPGQTLLDTSRLPAGSYEIDLEIREGGGSRSETQYFSSYGNLPAPGRPQWYLEAGQSVAFNARALDAFSEGPLIASFGRHQRFGRVWGTSADVVLSQSISHAELGVGLEHQAVSAGIGFVASDRGDQGWFLRGQGTLRGWRFNGSFRQIETEPPTVATEPLVYDPFPRAFRQARLSAQRSQAWGRYGVRGFYRETAGGRETWFAGSYVDFAILRSNDWRLNLELRGELGSDRSTRFVGVRLSKAFRGGPASNWRKRANVRVASDLVEARSGTARSLRRVIETDLQADQRRANGRQLQVFAGVRQEDIFGLRGGLHYRSDQVDARLDARRTYQTQNSVSLDMQSGLAIGSGGLSWTATTEESGAQVVLSQPSPDPIALQVGGQTRTIHKAGRTGFVPLRPFEIYDVGIQPLSASDIVYDQSKARVVAYPGNVIRVPRTVRPIKIYVGRLVDARGAPMADTVLKGDDVTGRTDEQGYFQIDGAGGDVLSAILSEDTACAFVLPMIVRAEAVYVNAGDLLCAD